MQKARRKAPTTKVNDDWTQTIIVHLVTYLTSLFPIVDLEMMARTPVQTNRRFRDDG